MTSKIIVNNIEADTGINTVTFNDDISSNTVRSNVIGNVIEVYENANIATFKNNQLRSDAAGAYYFDHGTTGQSFTFRTSTSSSLDTTGPSVTSAGNISFPSGKGIDFSATSDGSGASSVSEILDDYEEGTFTPSLTFATPGTSSFVLFVLFLVLFMP